MKAVFIAAGLLAISTLGGFKPERNPVYRPAGSSIMDTNIVNSFAKALLDSGYSIGSFEVPKLGAQPVALRSGIIPDEQEGFMELVIEQNMVDLNLITSIKGNFDNVIFMEGYRPRLDHDELQKPSPFLPYPGTKWLLALKSSIAPKGRILGEWLSKVKDIKKKKNYLNEKTAFELVKDPYSSLCLHWEQSNDKPYNLPMATDLLIKDLVTLQQTLNNLPADHSSPDVRNKLTSAISTLADPAGKMIGNAMLRRLPPSRPKPK
jgi:hypothetical protein